MDAIVEPRMPGRTAETVFTNARVIAPEEVIDGTVVVRDGRIVSVDSGTSHVAGAIDLDEDYLIPGLVELHTDNLERHYLPRPGVVWPATRAILAHDAEVATAGITTVFDALRVGYIRGETEIVRQVGDLFAQLAAAREAGVLRIDHQLHLRCEVSTADVVETLEQLIESPLTRLVSVMDHTPGQRQFADLDKYREYYGGKYGFNEEELDAFLAETTAAQARYSQPNRRSVVEMCRARGVTLASHDDANLAHVAEAASDNVAIAEFPTTVEAATASREHGMQILMGAPNLVRGGSHSGNVSAIELGRLGLLDILSSDYIPGSLVHAAFRLADEAEAYTLPQAIATVSTIPAKAVGLVDRGSIEAGKRADLVRVRRHHGTEIVRETWVGGQRVV
jgi:alpha-D-ribose 1-methylphosphonate 5-triphosphate diphosphatase